MKIFKIILLVLFLYSCNLVPDPETREVEEYQTIILGFSFSPDTVAVGDTVLIKCIIEDSLDTSFRFDWGLENKIPINGRIDSSVIKWEAVEMSQQTNIVTQLRRSVTVDNSSETKEPVSESFSIKIQQ